MSVDNLLKISKEILAWLTNPDMGSSNYVDSECYYQDIRDYSEALREAIDKVEEPTEMYRESSTHNVYRGDPFDSIACHCFADHDHAIGREVVAYMHVLKGDGKVWKKLTYDSKWPFEDVKFLTPGWSATSVPLRIGI